MFASPYFAQFYLSHEHVFLLVSWNIYGWFFCFDLYKFIIFIFKSYFLFIFILISFTFYLPNETSHPTTGRCSDVVVTSLCTSHWRRRYTSWEILNDVSMERHQDALMVRLHDVILEHRDYVSRESNNNAPSKHL